MCICAFVLEPGEAWKLRNTRKQAPRCYIMQGDAVGHGNAFAHYCTHKSRNGSKIFGDEQGACTREWHCIDYGIVSQAGYSTVHSFKVLPAEPISDHQPIECELVLHNLNVSVPGLVATEPPMAVPKWDPSKRLEYVRQLKSGESGIVLGEIEAGL